MANRGYDVVVDVDAEVSASYSSSTFCSFFLTPQQGDLGHTDLQEDLEFHPSSESPHQATATRFHETNHLIMNLE